MGTSFKTALVCLVAFSAFGRAYTEGQTIPEEEHSTWPLGTVETRLANGFCKYAPVAVETDTPGDHEDLVKYPELLEKMSKAEIVTAVETELGLEPGASGLDVTKLNKADLLIAAKTLLAQASTEPPAV